LFPAGELNAAFSLNGVNTAVLASDGSSKYVNRMELHKDHACVCIDCVCVLLMIMMIDCLWNCCTRPNAARGTVLTKYDNGDVLACLPSKAAADELICRFFDPCGPAGPSLRMSTSFSLYGMHGFPYV
jgi:hypothetical protein